MTLFTTLSLIPSLLILSDANHAEFQGISLRKAFGEAQYDSLEHVTRGLPPERICDWDASGFESKCDTDNQLVTLSIENSDLFRQIDIGFLPPSIKHLSLKRCRQEWSINTRHFPRSSEFIDLSRNSICGVPDFSALPENLVDLSLARNMLEGPMDFCGLPAGMRTMDLSYNRIRQDTILYGHLPKKLGFIGLEFNKINRTRPIAGQPRPNDQEYFYGLTKRGLF